MYVRDREPSRALHQFGEFMFTGKANPVSVCEFAVTKRTGTLHFRIIILSYVISCLRDTGRHHASEQFDLFALLMHEIKLALAFDIVSR